MTSASRSSDQLVDILLQIQARKTVKPEDATKALQQYRKVQEHIKALKAEIEIFKNLKQGQQSNPRLPKDSLSKGGNIKDRTVGIKQQRSAAKPAAKSQLAAQTTPRLLNGSNGSPLTPRTSKQISNKFEDKKTEKEKDITIQSSKQDEKVSSKDNKENSSSQKPLNDQQFLSTVKKNGEKDAGPDMIGKSQLVILKYFPASEKLIQDFKRIYDMEWRTAYHDLEKHYKLKEDVITELLGGIAKEAYMFCQACEKQQFEDIKKGHSHVTDILVQPKYASQSKDVFTAKSKAIIDKDGFQVTRRFLRDYRKAMARVPVPGLVDIFESLVQRDVISKQTSLRLIPKSTRPYMHKLIETNWLMALQDPPIAQVWPRGGQLMNRDWFTAYSKKGATVLHTVWPALLMQKDGVLAERGVCLVK